MIPLLSIFASSFIIALSGALMPGPLLTATVSESTKRGFIAGPMLILGHGILELGLVIGLLLGLAPYLEKDIVFGTIGIAGGVIMIWMAYGMFRSLPTLTISYEASESKQKNIVIDGILMSIANPYWILWWATIGLGYILHSMKFGIYGVAFFFTGHIMADLVWYATISAAIAKGRRFFSDKMYKGLIGFCALFLLFFAGYFFYSGLNKVLA